MKRILPLLTLCLSAFFTFGQHGSDLASDVESTSSKIHWLTFEEAFTLHQETPKKWVIDVSTVWCGWCKKMDKTTFSDSLVVDHVSESFYAVALDGEYKGDITLGDHTYEFVNEGQRGYHQLPSELMGGKRSYPTVVFLSQELQNLSSIPGYKNAADFLQIVDFFETYDATDNPITWNDFVASYVSPYPSKVVEETTAN